MSLYCTLHDLIVYAPPEILEQTTDDPGLEQINHDMITYVITQASDLIDSYIRGRYTVPIVAPYPAMIQDLCARISVYYLYKRQLTRTLPEPVLADYNYCTKLLVAIQQGKINPFPTTSEPTFFASNRSHWADVFTRAAPAGTGQAFQPQVVGAPNTAAGFGQNSWQQYRI